MLSQPAGYDINLNIYRVRKIYFKNIQLTKQYPLTQILVESWVHLVPSITKGFNTTKFELLSGLQNNAHFLRGS
jgi:hypothetical protein